MANGRRQPAGTATHLSCRTSRLTPAVRQGVRSLLLSLQCGGELAEGRALQLMEPTLPQTGLDGLAERLGRRGPILRQLVRLGQVEVHGRRRRLRERLP